jgi:hypothetical protein
MRSIAPRMCLKRQGEFRIDAVRIALTSKQVADELGVEYPERDF